MKYFLYAFLAMSLTLPTTSVNATSILATQDDEAKNLVLKAYNAGTAASKADREEDDKQNMNAFFHNFFDLKYMLDRIAGPLAKNLNSTDKAALEEAFVVNVANAYSNVFANYASWNLKVLNTSTANGITKVTTLLQQEKDEDKDDDLQIVWSLRAPKDSSELKIIDAKVESLGISIHNLLKELFDSSKDKNNGNVTKIIADLKNPASA